jgi:hypothetical protein
MAEASGFRWTTLRVAALYPFALLPWLARAIAWETLYLLFSTRRGKPPGIAALCGLLATGASALALTRSFNLDWPTWAVALTAYAAGGVIAAAIFGYVQIVRSEFPKRN